MQSKRKGGWSTGGTSGLCLRRARVPPLDNTTRRSPRRAAVFALDAVGRCESVSCLVTAGILAVIIVVMIVVNVVVVVVVILAVRAGNTYFILDNWEGQNFLIDRNEFPHHRLSSNEATLERLGAESNNIGPGIITGLALGGQ